MYRITDIENLNLYFAPLLVSDGLNGKMLLVYNDNKINAYFRSG